MRLRRVREVLTLLVFCRLACCQGTQEFDFESDIATWPQLKRQAGYRTESGKYLGGLYKKARFEEREFYLCLRDNESFCTEWLIQQATGGESKMGRCTCREETGPYCPMWTCSHTETEVHRSKGNDDDDDYHTVVHGKITRCFCSKTSPNENYCHAWNCVETGTDGTLENEHHRCLEEDESGEFCFRWKGDITSDKEVESSVCQCTDRKDGHCETWECVERGLVRCSKHCPSWCNVWIGVFVAGGLGLFFLALGGVISGLVPFFSLHPIFYVCYPAGLLLGLPWIAFVLIWGGVDAPMYVLPVWGLVILLPCLSFVLFCCIGRCR